MRLIDADKLEEAILTYEYDEFGDFQEEILDIIKTAPVVKADVWHPYPKEKPEKDKWYDVTVINGDGDVWIDEDCIYLDTDDWRFFGKEAMRKFQTRVIAWKEQDKPYKGDEHEID